MISAQGSTLIMKENHGTLTEGQKLNVLAYDDLNNRFIAVAEAGTVHFVDTRYARVVFNNGLFSEGSGQPNGAAGTDTLLGPEEIEFVKSLQATINSLKGQITVINKKLKAIEDGTSNKV